MKTFYYIAVSTSANREMSGQIESETEKDARKELNKMGLSILTISLEKPPNWRKNASLELFEFEAMDNTAKSINGTVEAACEIEAYNRLVDEFKFEPKYICKVDATESEKEVAHQNGVENILQKKKEKIIQEEDAKNRTLTGSIKALFKMGFKKTNKTMENEDNKEVVQSEGSEEKGTQDISEKEPGNVTSEDMPKIKGLLYNFKNSLKKIYYYFTELIVPHSGKNRWDALKEIKNLLLMRIDAEGHKKERVHYFDAMHRKVMLEKFWLLAEGLITALAIVYLAYFVIGTIALHYNLSGISKLAEKTLLGNTVIPFFAGACFFLRILMWLRERYTSWSALRTFSLFTIGGMVLFIIGVNFL